MSSTAVTREAIRREFAVDRARYLEIENSALRAQLKALQDKATGERVFAVMAENAGLRKALESLRADVDLAKDLSAKADAVREECARIAEARGMRELAVELRASVIKSQRSVINGRT